MTLTMDMWSRNTPEKLKKNDNAVFFSHSFIDPKLVYDS